MKMYIDKNADTTVEVMVTCRFCGEHHILKVKHEDFFAWKIDGKHVQDAMPYLTPNERELLISNTCQTCWDKMFADHEDEVWMDDDEDECFVLTDDNIDEFIDRFF